MGDKGIGTKCAYCDKPVEVNGGHIPRWCSVECRNYWLEEQEDAGIQNNEL
jgi:endogenous inhibitor of DNA gyrase (YacG/DUF329 family)